MKLNHYFIIGGVVLLVLLLILAPQLRKVADRVKETNQEVVNTEEEPGIETDEEGNEIDPDLAKVDPYIRDSQASLEESYGKAPKGFLWDQGGVLLSRGDHSMSAEDVVYTFLRSASTLDLASVQKFSRNSSVLERFEEVTSSQSYNNSYKDNFLNNSYREAMLSVEVLGIENIAVFASNKQSFSVKIKMLDLSNKDFWLKDKENLFNQLRKIDDIETDTAKAENLIYEYITEYYKSNVNDLKKEFKINLTVEKFVDVDSGWLVSIDKELDNRAQNREGVVLADYINSQFRDWLRDVKLREQESPNETVKETVKEETVVETQGEGN